MPLVKMVLGARYQFDNVLVKKGEVIEVDNRTRNRLVKGKHFIDVSEHERPAFVALPEDEQAPLPTRGGVSLDDIDDGDPDPDTGPKGGKGTGKVHRRSGSDIAEERAATAAKQVEVEGAETEEVTVE